MIAIIFLPISLDANNIQLEKAVLFIKHLCLSWKYVNSIDLCQSMNGVWNNYGLANFFFLNGNLSHQV